MSIFDRLNQSSLNRSFEKLIKDEQEKLYKIAYSYVKNEQDALDIVQDAIIKGYQSFHKLDDKAYFSTWMVRILINTSIDFLRKKKDVIKLDPEWLKSGHQQEHFSIMAMDIDTVFKKLKTDQKTLLLLRFYYGYSIPEIANILGMPEGTIKSRLHRTLQLVKEKLGTGGKHYGEATK